MSIVQDVLNREKGQIPVSIGTSLALEAGMGIYPDRPEYPPPFQNVKQLWINLRTLVRNLINCLPTQTRDRLLAEDIWEIVYSELHVIPTAVAEGSYGKVSVQFYVSEYARLKKLYPHAMIKEAKTEKQLFLEALEEQTLRFILSKNEHFKFHVFKHDIEGQHPASMIMTHLPIDLLNRYRFERLDLLESHTGRIKGPAAWNTKLTSGKDLPNLPFNAFTLQVFGDNGNMFSPFRTRLRQEVIALAERARWTSVTTVDKIRSDLRLISNDVDRKELTQLL